MTDEAKMPDEIWLSDDGNWRFARHSGNITNEGQYNGAVKYVRADLSALEAERGDYTHIPIKDVLEAISGPIGRLKVANIDHEALKKLDNYCNRLYQRKPHPPAVAINEQIGIAKAHIKDMKPWEKEGIVTTTEEAPAVAGDGVDVSVGDHSFKTMSEFIAYSEGRKDGWNANIEAQPHPPAVAGDRALEKEERAHSVTIDQRDRAQERADDLAQKIADFAGVDIGEHSNYNCPWENALEISLTPPDNADLAAVRDALEWYADLENQGKLPKVPAAWEGGRVIGRASPNYARNALAILDRMMKGE